jgi:hypothetical protein
MKKVFIILSLILGLVLSLQSVCADMPPGFPDDSNTVDGVDNGNSTTTSATLMRASNSPKVYEIKNNKRHWIPTAQIFGSYGFNWSNVQIVSESTLNAYPRAKLLRAIGDAKIYYLTESGMIRHIPTTQIFESYGNQWEDVFEVSSAEISVYEKNNLIRAQGDYKVYLLENGKKTWIRTAEDFNAKKYDWSKIAPVNQIEINSYAEI